MNNLNINGVDLDLDVLDADTTERVDAAMDEVLRSAAEIPADRSEADKIRLLCGVIRRCFDAVFGTGTAERALGQKNNLGVCTDAFIELSRAVRAQRQAWEKRTAKAAAKFSGADTGAQP